MSQNEKVVLGNLGAPYGIKGWLKVNSFTDDPEGIFDYQPWLLSINGKWVEKEVADWKKHNKGLVVKFADIDDRDDAHQLTNIEVGVDAERLPELSDDEFYWRELIGMRVVTNKGYDMGVIDDLLETGSNDVLVVKANSTDAFGKQERLIPYIPDQVILDINRDEKTVTIDWDPGF